MEANTWIKVLNYQNKDYKGDNFFGYTYIDHEAGLTVDVIKTFKIENGSILMTEDLIELKERILIRSEALTGKSEIHNLTEKEINQYNLLTPDYLTTYDKPKLEVFRKEKLFDAFRAPGYPDDIMILLPPTEKIQPEQVWLRVEEYEPEKKIVAGTLLNKPNQNFGVNKNDLVIAVYSIIENEPYFIANIDFDKIPKKKKWQFWK